MQKKVIITGILGAALLIGGGIGVVYANKPTEPATVAQADATQAPVVEASVQPKVEPQPQVEAQPSSETKPVETKTEPIVKAPVNKVETKAPAKTTEPTKTTTSTPASNPDPNATTTGKLVIHMGSDTNYLGDYVGEIKNGKANGQGTVTWRKNGDTWTGNFYNNSPAGDGLWTHMVDGKKVTERLILGI